MRDVGVIVLNIIRVCNIVSLLAVVAASFVMLVKTFVVSKFFFFDGVSHLIQALIAIGLIVTEVNLFRRYIATNWPLLSPIHGFVTLGVIMIILGVSVLGNLNKEATSQQSLGTPMWRCVISAGILACIFGIVNIFASYCFRDKQYGVSARWIRQHGRQAHEKPVPYTSPAPSSHPSVRRTRAFSLRRSHTTNDVLPSYHTRANSNDRRNVSAPVTAAHPDGLGMSYAEKNGYYASKDDKEGGILRPPVVNGMPKPELAHHPAFQVRPASSVYTTL
ncbi:uncharacterized protein KY384_006904 [Bacidia gigantensis]|uniref:uncharacterized protein n=1 Tax=Bacidia gigantensis TaxID=2732470 RepID=UPI001D0371C6|nr:uncharacterized protein KY384_006904 [Bacidia gigantensis]KAG8527988.1 hypothetical protein KY384_006904 [Bacidia gigantensis]